MAVTSDSHAIQLGKFKSRAAAIDAVMLFSLRVGEFDPAHFAPQVRERAAAVVADEVDATEEE